MRRTRPQPRFTFWLLWVFATIVGWSARRVLLEFPEMANFGVLYLASFFGNGLLIGWLQWLMLYRYVRAGVRKSLVFGSVWIFSNALGWLLAWSLNALFPTLFVFAANAGYSIISISLMAGSASSLVSGGLQWFVLRGHIKRAWLWLPVNMLSMVAGMYAHQNIPMLQATLAWIVGGAVYGILSGIGLVYLFRQSRSAATPIRLAESKAQHASPDFR